MIRSNANENGIKFNSLGEKTKIAAEKLFRVMSSHYDNTLGKMEEKIAELISNQSIYDQQQQRDYHTELSDMTKLILSNQKITNDNISAGRREFRSGVEEINRLVGQLT